MQKLFFVLALCISLPVAHAQESGKLQGLYGFYGDVCLENSKAADCKMTFGIDGASARAMYDRMPQAEVKDECTNGFRKEDGKHLRCYRVADEYSCDFGYSFSKSAFVDSDTTC